MTSNLAKAQDGQPKGGTLAVPQLSAPRFAAPMGMANLGGRRRLGKVIPSHARSHNRSLVLQETYLYGPLSRADLARSTGLAKVTVSDLVASLLEEGLLEELGTSDSQRAGKPAVLVDIARTSFEIVTVDLAMHDRFTGALMDMDARIYHREEVMLGSARGAEAVELAVSLVQRLVKAATKPILGIGIGSPGIVNDEGAILLTPNLEWEKVPLRDIIAQSTGLSTSVGNDANMAAVAEFAFSEEGSDLILISVGHGVGAGLMVSGQLVRGSRFAAGEIGQVMVGTDCGLDAPYSRDEILEHWISVPSLSSRIAAADLGDREAILREAGQRLGIALAPVVGALNLTQVVLSGPPDLIGGTVADMTLQTIRNRTIANSHEQLEVRMTNLGIDNVLYGCAAMVLTELLGLPLTE